MALGGTYNTGLLSVTAGSTAVSGHGVLWSDVEEGDWLQVGAAVGVIDSVDGGFDDIVLKDGWAGPTVPKGTATMTIASPCVVTWPATAPPADTPCVLSTTGALATGLTAGTVVYCKSPSGSTSNLAATPGGAAINTSGSQSGVHTIGAPYRIYYDSKLRFDPALTQDKLRTFINHIETAALFGVPFEWDTGTSDADPGAGLIRANNASLASATLLYISKTSRVDVDVSAFLAALDDSTNPLGKGTLFLGTQPNGEQAIFTVGAVTNATNYIKLTISGASGVTSFLAGDLINFQFIRTGDAAGNETFVSVTAPKTLSVTDAYTHQVCSGNSFDAITFPTATVFNPGSVIKITNADTYSGSGTGRARVLVTPAGNEWMLYPGMWVEAVALADGTWRFNGPKRWRVPGVVVTAYVNTSTGSDTFGERDGLASSSAFLSAGGAIYGILNVADFSCSPQTTLVVKLAAGQKNALGTHFSWHGIPGAQGGSAIKIQGASQAVLALSDNGSGLVRVEVATTANLTTDDVVSIYGDASIIAGAAFGIWKVTVIDGTHVDLQGSTFAGNVGAGHGTITDGSGLDTSTSDMSFYFGAVAQFQDLTIVGINGIQLLWGAKLYILDGVILGACSGVHIIVAAGAYLEATNYGISAQAAYHLSASKNGVFQHTGYVDMLPGSTQAYTAFASVTGGRATFGTIRTNGATVTGQRAVVSEGGYLTGATGIPDTDFPGSTASAATTGGLFGTQPLLASAGGTGVQNNKASTLTISGSFGTTFTITGTTNVTLPTSGTLVPSASPVLTGPVSMSGSIKSTQVPSTQAQLDMATAATIGDASALTSSFAISPTSSGNYYKFSIAEVDIVGAMAEYLCQNGVATLLSGADSSWEASTQTPASGKFSVAWDSGVGVYKIYNNNSTAARFKVWALRFH